MDREMIDKNVAILELLADFKIAVTQLQEDYKNARTRADIAENAIEKLKTEKHCADIKMDRVLNRLKNMLKEGAVITKDDIQYCITILEND
jgi:thiamine pyrophosphate-dependent acetolactate synthase large subunit-like protein